MKTLVELNSTQHRDLKVAPDTAARFAASQHLMNLRAQEIANAASSFAVFASRNNSDGAIAFSALTSFTAGHNLYVKGEKWDAVFRPMSIQTHPVYLMQSPRDAKSYTFGIVEKTNDFSTESGHALFDDAGQPTDFLSRINNMLQDSIQQDMQTQQFAKEIEALGLFKSLDLNVQYDDGQLQKIQGLQTINEERLQALSSQELDELHKKGYLMPIHAMLVSLFQVNVLINKHNEQHPARKVVQVKMEVSKDTQLI